MYPTYNAVYKMLKKHGLGWKADGETFLCPDAKTWLRENQHKGTKWLWDNCTQADWMMFFLDRVAGHQNWLTKDTFMKVFKAVAKKRYKEYRPDLWYINLHPLYIDDATLPDKIREIVPNPYTKR